MSTAPESTGQPAPFILVDLMGYVFRAYHALPPLTAPDGSPSHALYGLANMLVRLLENQPEARIVAVKDAPGPSWRHDIYPAYKANRPPAPEDLVAQLTHLDELLTALGLPIVEQAGHEADDLIAELALAAHAEGTPVVIASSDKDLMQLVRPGVEAWDPMRDRRYDAAEVERKWGVSPERIPDLFGLMGDSSDNVPGVRGIGPKRANQLLAEYGTLDGILAALDELPDQAWARNLRDGVEDARISRRLVELPGTRPAGIHTADLQRGAIDFDALRAYCLRFGFQSLAARLPALAERMGSENDAAAAQGDLLSQARLDLLEDPADLAAWLGDGPLGFDTETTSLQPRQATIVGFSLAREGHAVYIPLAHREGHNVDLERIRPALAAWAGDPEQKKWGQHLKYDAQILRGAGMELRGVAGDAMLASQLLRPDGRGHGLDALAARELGHSTISFSEAAPTGDFRDVRPADAARYAGEDALVARALCVRLHDRLREQGLWEVYERIEMPLVTVLADMEWWGIAVDRERLQALRQELRTRLAGLEAAILRRIEQPINLQSPKQVGELLFDRLGLPSQGVRRTKTGAWSTDAEVLERLRDAHPVVGEILEHRGLSKLLQTYADALLEAVLPETGRIHPSFHQLGAATGRLSCSDPNLQNIPVRDEWGRRFRQCFVPAEGMVFVGADYSQIELRILAHLAGDEALVEAFRQGDDIHARTAADLFDVGIEAVQPEQRRAAKTINFGLIYGMGAQRLGQSLEIPTKEAAAWIEKYFERYPGVARFRDSTVAQARERGFVETMFGRRRHLPGPGEGGRRDPSAIERIAMNTPIQGAAADLIKLAMIELHRRLAAEIPGARLILQVHDELLVEAPAADGEQVRALLTEAMTGVATLDVPLQADAGVGASWDEVH